MTIATKSNDNKEYSEKSEAKARKWPTIGTLQRAFETFHHKESNYIIFST